MVLLQFLGPNNHWVSLRTMFPTKPRGRHGENLLVNPEFFFIVLKNVFEIIWICHIEADAHSKLKCLSFNEICANGNIEGVSFRTLCCQTGLCWTMAGHLLVQCANHVTTTQIHGRNFFINADIFWTLIRPWSIWIGFPVSSILQVSL